jgi:hypothetical protein
MKKVKERIKVDSPWGFVLCMAYVGALVYFLQRNHGFWGDVWAFFQAAAWPTYVVFKALTHLHV